MATQWDDIDVRCPYYNKHDKMSISCEGIDNASSGIKMMFKTKEGRRKHMGTYCNNGYSECSINKLCEKKYD